MKPATRIAFNTIVLYARMILVLAIGLIITRLVLDALGENDFGIFTLIAGVIGLLGVLNSSLTHTSMRFMAHSLGVGSNELLLKTFNTTYTLHLIMAVVVAIIMEVGGMIMFDYILNIPEHRIHDAKIVFHLMIVTTFISIITVPFDAVINAHENLLALSIAEIIGYLIKLALAVYMSFSKSNLLVLYGGGLLIIQIILYAVKMWYSRIMYNECRLMLFKFTEMKLIRNILTFFWWNLFGSIAAITVIHIRGILLNIFFGVSINAADGISKNVSAQVNAISVNMTSALNPQLVKSEGGGDRLKMLWYTQMATKFSVILFALIAIPVIAEITFLLNIWLNKVPEYTVVFCKLILIGLFLDKFSFEITTALKAVGKIRNFQISETLLILLTIPISFIAFKKGYNPNTIFYINIMAVFIAFFIRIYFGKKDAGIQVRNFILNGIKPVIIPVLAGILVSYIIQLLLPSSYLRLFLSSVLPILTISTLFWFYGLNKDENYRIKATLVDIKCHFRKILITKEN